MEKKKGQVRKIARTGLMIALLVTLQWITAPTAAFVGQYITGSCVNCVLVVATLLCGLYSGVFVAVISPFCAFLLNIGPKLLQIVPAIALGNIVLVLCVHFLLGRASLTIFQKVAGLVSASFSKFAMMYIAVVRVLIPVMGPAISEKQATTFVTMFSWPQMVTAFVGGTIALLMVPVLKKVIKQ